MTRTRAAVSGVIALAIALAVTGCFGQGATPTVEGTASSHGSDAPSALPEPDPHASSIPESRMPRASPPEGPVLAQGLVVDRGGEVQMCLGAVGASNPPTCDGPGIVNWNWETVGEPSSAFGVTYDGYAFSATYDGSTLRVLSTPIPLDFFDSAVWWEDPTQGVPGVTAGQTLHRIQREITPWFGGTMLGSHIENGRLWVEVAWDDGTWQRFADEVYGTAVVIVKPALLELSGDR